MNRVYLGSGTFGIGAAAHHYFGKKPQDLTIYEAAVIAGLLKAPSKYSPSNNPDLADQRATQVLENMAKHGFISEDLKDASIALASSTTERFRGSTVRYFTDWIVDILPRHIEVNDRDLVVTTTLDPALQSIAETKAQEVLTEHREPSKVSQLSLVSMTHEGAIRALVGGADYKKSQYNRVTQAIRQPGSAFKMFVYLTALESGMTPQDWISDMPVRIGSWQPKNYKYKARGEITLQDAMAYSVNSVSVRLAQRLGHSRIVETARRLGLQAPLPNDLTIVLGTGETTALELTTAYAVIARKGLSVTPYAILKVTDHAGNALYTHQAPTPERLIDPGVVQSLTQMMQSVVAYGTGKKAALDRPAAGKTGTTQQYKDLWFIGFTPELVTGVWAGNDDNTSLDPKLGSPSVKLWRLFMAETPRQHVPFLTEEIPAMQQEPEAEQPSSGFIDQLLDDLFGG